MTRPPGCRSPPTPPRSRWSPTWTRTTTWRARSCSVTWRTRWQCAAWPRTRWLPSAGRSSWCPTVRMNTHLPLLLLSNSTFFLNPALKWHLMLLFPPCFLLFLLLETLGVRQAVLVSVEAAVRWVCGQTADRDSEEGTLRHLSQLSQRLLGHLFLPDQLYTPLPLCSLLLSPSSALSLQH